MLFYGSSSSFDMPLPCIPVPLPCIYFVFFGSTGGVSGHSALGAGFCCRRLVQQEAAKLEVARVQQQLQEGNRELAIANLSRESELGELRNQIAIVRCAAAAAPVPESWPARRLVVRSQACSGCMAQTAGRRVSCRTCLASVQMLFNSKPQSPKHQSPKP